MIIDLSTEIKQGMYKYPSDPELEIVDNEIAEVIDGKVRSAYMQYKIRNHHGTHMDAPAHKIAGGKTIDEYGLEKFIDKKAFLVDLTSRNIMARDKKEINLADLADKFNYTPYEDVKAIVFYTGFSDLRQEYDGKLFGNHKTDFEKTFPYFTMQAVEHIYELAPYLDIIGIDSFSVDPKGSNSEIHKKILGVDTLILETLSNLRELSDAINSGPQKSFKLDCAPILYKNADAAQVRAYATILNGE